MEDYFVPSKCCREASTHKVTEFKDISKKSKSETSLHKGRELNEDDFMKKARFEVYKFAQSGLTNVEQQRSQFDLAIKLGAVPRKNKYVNYKILKEERKKINSEAQEKATLKEKSIDRKIKSKNPKIKLKRKRKIGSAILKSYGKLHRKKEK